MKNTLRFTVLTALLLASVELWAQAPPAARKDPAKAQQEAMVKDVFSRLLTVPDAAKPIKAYDGWPPDVAVIDPEQDPEAAESVGKYNAFAAAPLCYPIVRITQPLLQDVIQGDPDRLALILGHELGHVLLGHVDCAESRDLSRISRLSFTRDKEFAADAKGWELGLAAGYSVRNGLKGLQRLRQMSNYSSFEALSADHPSWSERLARLDQAQAPLWHVMSAFEDGVYFLNAENYPLAERCFRGVTVEFPSAYEAWANLGYAQLMEYADGLRPGDLRQFGIGHIAAGAFYSQPASVAAKVRGINAQLWGDAVASLQQAENLNPKLALVKANLGLAYLLRPAGKDLEKAIAYLQQAASLLQVDPTLAATPNRETSTPVVAVANNLAVALAAAGRKQEAFKLVQSGAKYVSADADPGVLQLNALRYNFGMLLVESSDPQQRGEGLGYLEVYLKEANDTSAWWPLAYERYTQVCREMNMAVKTQAQLQRATRRALREVSTIELGPGKSVTLGESSTNLRTAGGTWREISTVSGTRIRRLRSADNGLDVLVDDKVLAMILRDPKGPAVNVKGIGADTRTDLLRVGMTAQDVDRILQAQAYRFESLGDTWTPYRYYPFLGVAMMLGANRTVDELVVMPTSRQ